MSIEFILVKLSVDVMVRLGEKAILQQKKKAFDDLSRFSKNQRVLERMLRGVTVSSLRRGFQGVRGCERQARGQLFDDSFSVIVRQDRARR